MRLKRKTGFVEGKKFRMKREDDCSVEMTHCGKSPSLMKKGISRVAITFLIAVTAICIGACGNRNEAGRGEPGVVTENELDMDALAEALMSGAGFDCSLEEMDEESISSFIYFGDAAPEEERMYMGNGAYSDSIGIFRFADQATAEAGNLAVADYLSSLGASFANYIPEETAKVENAVVVKAGKYVVFVVAPLRDPDGNEQYESIRKTVEGSFTECEVTLPEDPNDNGGLQAAGSNENSGTTEKLENPEGGLSDGSINPLDVTDSFGPEAVVREETKADGDKTSADKKKQGEFPYIKAKGKFKNYGGILVIGAKGFELYNYVDSIAETYAGFINKAADELEGTAKVYDLVVPLACGIVLPDKYEGKTSCSDMKSSMESIYKKMDDNVTCVNIYYNMMKHRDQKLYFRTDHHWTQLGAYYAYQVLMGAMGKEYHQLDEYETKSFKGYKGTLAYNTKDDELNSNPDKITAYYPISNVSIRQNINGETISKPVVDDMTDYGTYNKYGAYIYGDNPQTYIKNKDLDDGSCCIIVKESFGNCFVPFVCDHYQKTYVIDYRYWEGNLAAFAKEKGATDVIFINNIGMVRSSYLVGMLGEIL